MKALTIFGENETKMNFRLLLEETKAMVQDLLNEDASDIYGLIMYELNDMMETIVDLGLPLDEDEINQRYSLGAIAIKNFDQETELYKRMTTLFYGAMVYSELD